MLIPSDKDNPGSQANGMLFVEQKRIEVSAQNYLEPDM